jgi:hypothetical protein
VLFRRATGLSLVGAGITPFDRTILIIFPLRAPE